VYELVADQLTGQIGARRLQPGDTLPPERELTESFGVGRSSVREALRMLESRGLIESKGNGTFTVSDFSNPLNQSLGLLLSAEEADLDELFEVRRLLEGETAALAALRRTDAHLGRMRDAIAQMEHALDSERHYIEADLAFHLTIADATGNRLVSRLMHAIRDQVQRALDTAFDVPGSAETSLGQHREIFDAIEQHRPDDARQRMHEHIARVESDVNRMRGERG